MYNKKEDRKPRRSISFESFVIQAVEDRILIMSEKLGRKISLSEAINRMLMEFMGYPIPSFYRLRERRESTKLSKLEAKRAEAKKKKLEPNQLIELFEQSSPEIRQVLLDDPNKGDIIRALYKTLTGKELPHE